MGELLTLASRDVGDVEETWRRFVPSASLQKVDPRTFGFSWTSAAIPGFSVVSYRLAATVQSAIEPDDQLMACRVASRGAWVGTPRGDLNAGLPWLAMDGPTSAHWERVFQHVAGTLFAPGPGSAIIEAELRRHALHTTLAAFSPAFVAALERSAQRTAAPRTVRRAIAYMEQHAHEAITIDDVASAADISPRGLQYAFRRALDQTPTEYLRHQRLAGAHAELQQGTGAAVSEIAQRWGFASASRFARHYREAYGRSPSRTRRGD